MNPHLTQQGTFHEGAQETPIQVSMLPGMYDFREELTSFQPSAHALFLARTADGPLTTEFPAHGHIVVAGPTHSGKSIILRLLLGQFLALNVNCYVCDAHYMPYNPSNDLDWTMIEQRLAHAPFRKASETASFLQWLALDELETRKELAYHRTSVGPPIVVVIEGLAGLIAEVPEVVHALRILLHQSLKYGIVLVLSSQDLLAKSLGLDSLMLEQIGTGYFCGGDSRTARAALHLHGSEHIDEEEFRPGVVYVRTRGLGATLGRIPWPDNASMQTLCELSHLPIHDRVRTQDVQEQRENSLPAMNEERYVTEIMRTYAGPDRMQEKLTLAALGLAGETGEVVDSIKKYLFQKHELPVDAMGDELGDVLWYFMLMCNTLGFTLEQVMTRNVTKLQKRYPNGFESHRSVNRDHLEERREVQ